MGGTLEKKMIPLIREKKQNKKINKEDLIILKLAINKWPENICQDAS